eukprot:417704-Lingulodinium_polyedra.AAC.1
MSKCTKPAPNRRNPRRTGGWSKSRERLGFSSTTWMPRAAQISSTLAVKPAHLAEAGRPEHRRAGVHAVHG